MCMYIGVYLAFNDLFTLNNLFPLNRHLNPYDLLYRHLDRDDFLFDTASMRVCSSVSELY